MSGVIAGLSPRPAGRSARWRVARSGAGGAAFLCWFVAASVGAQSSAAPGAETVDGVGVADRAAWGGNAAANFSLSSGNSASAALGLDAEAGGGVGRFRLSFDAGAFRAGASEASRVAVGAADDFEVRREAASEPSANRAHFRVRLAGAQERELGAFAAAGWERDRPAGVLGRYDLTAGLGRTIGGGGGGGVPEVALSAGLSLVRQRDAVPDEETADDTLGLRLGARTEGRLRAAALSLDAATVWNLRERGDLRLDATGAAELPISGRLALRASLQTLFDSRPALERIPLAPAVGAEPVGEVAARRARLDSILLASLAVRW